MGKLITSNSATSTRTETKEKSNEASKFPKEINA